MMEPMKYILLSGMLYNELERIKEETHYDRLCPDYYTNDWYIESVEKLDQSIKYLCDVMNPMLREIDPDGAIPMHSIEKLQETYLEMITVFGNGARIAQFLDMMIVFNVHRNPSATSIMHLSGVYTAFQDTWERHCVKLSDSFYEAYHSQETRFLEFNNYAAIYKLAGLEVKPNE